MQVNSCHQNVFHFHLSPEKFGSEKLIWKVWKGRKKIRKIGISREQKTLFR